MLPWHRDPAREISLMAPWVTQALLCCWLACAPGFAQAPDSASIPARIQQAALASDYGYRQLERLCNGIGPRLPGSRQAEAAVDFVAGKFREMGLKVTLEATGVPHWVRGEE